MVQVSSGCRWWYSSNRSVSVRTCRRPTPYTRTPHMSPAEQVSRRRAVVRGTGTIRYGAVCSSLACLTVRRRRARLGRACQRAPTQPPPEDRLKHEPTQATCLASSVPSPAGAPSFNFLSCGDDDETTASGRKQHYSHSSLAGHAACPGSGHFQQPMSSRAMDRDRPRLYQ